MSYPTALLYTDMGHIFHGTALLKGLFALCKSLAGFLSEDSLHADDDWTRQRCLHNETA